MNYHNLPNPPMPNKFDKLPIAGHVSYTKNGMRFITLGKAKRVDNYEEYPNIDLIARETHPSDLLPNTRDYEPQITNDWRMVPEDSSRDKMSQKEAKVIYRNQMIKGAHWIDKGELKTREQQPKQLSLLEKTS